MMNYLIQYLTLGTPKQASQIRLLPFNAHLYLSGVWLGETKQACVLLWLDHVLKVLSTIVGSIVNLI